MDNYQNIQRTWGRLLERWGGGFIIRIILFTQVLSFITSAIGILFVTFTADLTETQLWEYIIGTITFTILSCLLVVGLSNSSTHHSRARLNQLHKKTAVQTETNNYPNEDSAWREIQGLPSRYGMFVLSTTILVTNSPVIFYLDFFGQVNLDQSILLIAGSVLMAVINQVFHVFFLDYLLGPVRVALFSKESETPKKTGISFSQRIFMTVFSLVMISSLLLAVEPIARGQYEYFLLIIVILIFATILGFFQSITIRTPINEITHVLEQFLKGERNSRPTAVTSDELSILTSRLKTLLDDLQASGENIQEQVAQSTLSLTAQLDLYNSVITSMKEISALPDLGTILEKAPSIIKAQFHLQQVSVFLTDSQSESLVLRSSSSSDRELFVQSGFQINIGQQGIIGTAAYQKLPQVILNPDQDPVLKTLHHSAAVRTAAAVPLSVKNKLIGVVEIHSEDVSHFSQDFLVDFQTLADHFALIIHSFHLSEENDWLLARSENIQLENIRNLWRRLPGVQKRLYKYQPVVSSSSVQKSEASSLPSSQEMKLTIPISLRGQTIGRIHINRRDDNGWSDAESTLAQDVANQIALALENSQLLMQAQERAFQEQSLSELTARLSRSTDTETLLRTAVQELHKLPNVREVAVYLTPPGGISSDVHS